MINIKTDSRKVQEGDTFVAIKGYTVDGHNYIEQAINKGATTIVCEHIEQKQPNINYIVVDNSEEWLQKFLVTNYKDEINKLKFIGVTGTNGKTTTCYLTYQELLLLGINACYIGTIGYYSKDEHYELPNTTPQILDLYSMFINAIEKGITTVVMEVSSHSLVKKRTEGIEFDAIAFTNLTEDHLDFHKTMDNYLNAKLLILDQLSPNGTIIINNDDPYAEYFKKGNYKCVGYNDSYYQIDSYDDTSKQTNIKFKVNGEQQEVSTNLKTKFNVYNYLTSVGLINALGIPVDKILSVSDKVQPPRGRCEQITYNNSDIVIDYAHTPDAVEKIITAFQENETGKIITIIGCGGDRDKLKRPIMGEIATSNSYYVIFTSDNPRTEDPNEIINDIVKGLKKDNYKIVKDRVEAIQAGIDMINPGDTLLVLGKGHEDYQIIGTVKHHLDDKEEVLKYIKKKG